MQPHVATQRQSVAPSAFFVRLPFFFLPSWVLWVEGLATFQKGWSLFVMSCALGPLLPQHEQMPVKTEHAIDAILCSTVWIQALKNRWYHWLFCKDFVHNGFNSAVSASVMKDQRTTTPTVQPSALSDITRDNLSDYLQFPPEPQQILYCFIHI